MLQYCFPPLFVACDLELHCQVSGSYLYVRALRLDDPWILELIFGMHITHRARRVRINKRIIYILFFKIIKE